MEEIINDLYDIIKDYRSHENNPDVLITPARIHRWINQFDQTDKLFILTELKHIFQARYFSKLKAKAFLVESINFLVKHYKYKCVDDFLSETIFLHLQSMHKSQSALILLLGEVLHEEFEYNIDNCGTLKNKNYIYIDDILCTGNTLYNDIKKWVSSPYDKNHTFLEQLLNHNINLGILYIYIHQENYYKKRAQFRHSISANFDRCFELFRKIEIENGVQGKLDLLFPSEDNQPDSVQKYFKAIDDEVNKNCVEKNYPEARREFYRPKNQPNPEVFFTSAVNRKRLEDIFLLKGIEILSNANTHIANVRALGYALPTHKNFGFGTLCVTWRNVPNNCPLVFWYLGGGFYPLFVKNHT